MTFSVQQEADSKDRSIDIEALRVALESYQPKPSNPKKEAFLTLYPIIQRRITDGLTVKQVRQILHDNGLDISHATLVRYLRDAKASVKEPSGIRAAMQRSNSESQQA